MQSGNFVVLDTQKQPSDRYITDHEESSNSNNSSPGHEPLTKRSARFGDWNSIEVICQIGGGGGGTRSFYSGHGVSERMNSVREAIKYIRVNWDNYSVFMEDLRPYMEEMPSSGVSAEDRHRIATVLSSSKEWSGRRHGTHLTGDFSTIRLYTSDYGYARIFKIINEAFRTDDFTNHEMRLRSAVFLIELLNIDLFNYHSQIFSNFQGIVYRGLTLSTDALQEFKDLAVRKSVRDRYWAIPLAMMSCSGIMNTALSFATEEVERFPDAYPCLWRIHVFELDPQLLHIYHQRFPSSVVSTICAVPVDRLSDFQENEVLLRSPFFQLIRVQIETLEDGNTVHVMDAVMLNTNRDHPSTMELEEPEGNKARQLFACLIGMGRAKICKELAEEYNLLEDSLAYARLYQEEKDKFSSFDDD